MSIAPMPISLSDGLLWYGVFLFSTICHEAAHAWAAMHLGDETAAQGGQVSINPLPHVRREPLGMLVIPLLSLFVNGSMVGWASAPYNADWARQYPRRAALMALAGPGANLGLALAAALLILAGARAGYCAAPLHLGGMHMTASLLPVLELPARSIYESGTRVGDQLVVCPPEEMHAYLDSRARQTGPAAESRRVEAGLHEPHSKREA